MILGDLIKTEHTYIGGKHRRIQNELTKEGEYLLGRVNYSLSVKPQLRHTVGDILDVMDYRGYAVVHPTTLSYFIRWCLSKIPSRCNFELASGSKKRREYKWVKK